MEENNALEFYISVSKRQNNGKSIFRNILYCLQEITVQKKWDVSFLLNIINDLMHAK